MVGHQAIAPYGDPGGGAALRQQRPISAIVIIAEKHLLSTIATLSDVMRHPFHHNTRQSSHASHRRPRAKDCQLCIVSPDPAGCSQPIRPE